MDKATLIKITQDLIQLDTVNDHEEAVSDYLTTLFTTNGISTKKLTYAPGRTSLIAEIGDPTSKQVLVFSGHQDTVATGDAADWPYAGPFSGELHAGRIYGRGAADMKSGLTAMAATLIALKDTPLKGRLRFVATVGEEFGAHGARELTEQGYADDFSGLVIGEPTGQKLIYAHSGSIDYTVTSIGKAAHSSLPETGINAITNLVKFITAEAH
ncbi:MAG: M20/M25/M40 family metallo-hydrolase, partial [Loigolactobacillus coryniformis]|nr:M20/M25/M40 family metallo-hydrolase [Loigolactobacillus coryniformis]